MTELSFNEHANEVYKRGQTQDVDNDSFDDDENGSMYIEKHVTINDDELPVIYKPKSYSVPDLMDNDCFQHSKHQHPALKFSTSNASVDTAFMKRFFPKEKPVTCSPFMHRRNKSHYDSELTRQRGKTFPSFDEETTTNNTSSTIINDSNRSNSKTKHRTVSAEPTSTTLDSKWMNFLKKINLLPKFQKMRIRKKPNNNIDSLPPISTSASMEDLLNLSQSQSTNNNVTKEITRDKEHIFPAHKSYSPGQFIFDTYMYDQNKTVKLKRIKSLPLL